MLYQHFYNFCLSQKGAEPTFPFGDEHLVIKVGGKMFALTSSLKFDFVNLKCDPILSLEFQASYAGIRPGYHMNKKHWISISTDGSVPDELIYECTKNSYNLVFSSLPKAKRDSLLIIP